MEWIISRPIEACLRLARESPGDNPHVAHLEMFNWFAQHLGRPPKRPLAGKDRS